MDEDFFWGDLLALIRRRELVTVVGPDMTLVEVDGREQTLTSLIGQRQASQDALKARYVAACYQGFPTINVSQMRLAFDVGPQQSQVAFDPGVPLRKGGRRQLSCQLTVQHPRATF